MNLRKIQLIIAAKWALYVLLVFLASILQGTPGLFVLFSVKPVWILPVCVAVSAMEGEYEGAFLGAFGGLMWDLSAGNVAGFFAILLAFSCFCTGYLFKMYFRQTRINIILISGGATIFMFMADFLFNYLLRNYSGVGNILLFQMIPTILYTALISPLPFWAVKKICEKIKVRE